MEPTMGAQQPVDDDNPTEFWCSKCQVFVNLDLLVEVQAGFLEHEGHYVD